MSKYSQAVASAIVELENQSKKFNWTEDAVFCKMRGCNCKGCKYDDLPSISAENKKHGCRMKKHVIDLVKTLGKPEGIPEPGVLLDKEEFLYLKDKYSLETLCSLYDCTRAEMKYRLNEAK